MECLILLIYEMMEIPIVLTDAARAAKLRLDTPVKEAFLYALIYEVMAIFMPTGQLLIPFVTMEI